jgi:hypothetical protein
MDFCEGMSRRQHHARIVHEEGWANCPLCRALRQVDDLQERLTEAEVEIEGMQDRLGDMSDELALARRDAAGE